MKERNDYSAALFFSPALCCVYVVVARQVGYFEAGPPCAPRQGCEQGSGVRCLEYVAFRGELRIPKCYSDIALFDELVTLRAICLRTLR